MSERDLRADAVRREAEARAVRQHGLTIALLRELGIEPAENDDDFSRVQESVKRLFGPHALAEVETFFGDVDADYRLTLRIVDIDVAVAGDRPTSATVTFPRSTVERIL